MTKLLVLILIAFALITVIAKAEKSGEYRFQIIPGERLVEVLKQNPTAPRGENATPHFKVRVKREICVVEPAGGLPPYGGLGGNLITICQDTVLACPDKMEVPLPGTSITQEFPLECRGPDANGDCECDIKETDSNR